MRDLQKNQRPIYYSLYGSEENIDEWGNTVKGYGEPKRLMVSLSVNKGEANGDVFGKDLDYDREFVVHDINCPIDEFTHLWIGIGASEDFNYIVKKVAVSLNAKRYAIKRVDVDENNKG